ncbi:MAG: type II toxin-antitoxin system RelE/ParE family toxin [Bryobacterales bacterium]|nr:type II toxin-antitoxin system RelE/ParE family toxin [Bryobacterales bacterium]
MGIRSFGSRATKRFARGDRRRLPPGLASKIADVLERLDSMSSPADLREAGYQIHRLTGDRKGAHAVRISGAWRVVFRFEDGNAYDVEVVDYHRS